MRQPASLHVGLTAAFACRPVHMTMRSSIEVACMCMVIFLQEYPLSFPVNLVSGH